MKKIRKYLIVLLCNLQFIAYGQTGGNYPSGAHPVSGVDYASGNIGLTQDLLRVEGYKVSLSYNSEGVQEKASSSNESDPTSIVGLGWAIGRNRVVRVTQQTGNTDDDKYLLHFSGSVYELVCVGAEGVEEINFRIQGKPNWKIVFYSVSDQWKVLKDNGREFVFGDGDFITHTATATEYNVKWGNWIGSSVKSSGTSLLSIGWNLSQIEEVTGEKVKLFYDRVDEQVGSNGLRHTQSSYLKKVQDFSGRYIELVYANKLSEEYVDPHIESNPRTRGRVDANDKDAYQERFETKYLDSLSLYNIDGNHIRTMKLGYGFLNSTHDLLKKRVLKNVSVKGKEGREAEPPILYTYHGERSQEEVTASLTNDETVLYHQGALYGAIKSQTTSEGLTYGYEYKIEEIGGSSRTIDISFPDDYTYQTGIENYTKSVGWSAPELFFSGDYVVAIFELEALDDQLSRIRVYEWIGDRWKASDMIARSDLPESNPSRYVFSGHFYDYYRPDDAIDPSLMSALKLRIFKSIGDAPGGELVGGIFNAFEDLLKDEAKTIYHVGEDISHGELGLAVEDYFRGEEQMVKDVVKDIAKSIEEESKKIAEGFVYAFGTNAEKYETLQGELYDNQKDYVLTHPEKRYHITLQDNFFALVTSDGGLAANVFKKSLLEDGAWDGESLPVNVISRYVDIVSGNNFFVVLDELSDFVYIYTWDGLYWEGKLTQFGMYSNESNHLSPSILGELSDWSMELDPNSDSDQLAIRRSSFRTAVCARNNTIVGAITDANGNHIEFNILHHNKNYNWEKVRVNDSKRSVGGHDNIMASLLGNDGRIKLSMGNSFAALQTYSNLNSNLVPSVEDVPLIGGVLGDFIADDRKVNSTYALTWNEDFTETAIVHLHTGWGQDGIGVIVTGDVINKVGKAHTLLVPENATSPENGKNYAFRYDGGRFMVDHWTSPYYSSAFSPDISSILTESNGGTDKRPQFYQYNANGIGRDIGTSSTVEHFENIADDFKLLGEGVYEKDWIRIEEASRENIPAPEFIDEAINVSFDVLNAVIQIVGLVVPLAGELIESAEALKVLQKIGNVADKAGFVAMVAQPIMNELVEDIMGTNHKSTSISNGYISVNGKLFHRNPNGSWLEITDNTFSLSGGSDLVGSYNSITGNYINYTVKEERGGVRNYVKLLKNGEVYKTIELDDNGMVIHHDSLTNVAGVNAFVAYGPVDHNGKVVISSFRRRHEGGVEEFFNDEDVSTGYKDAQRVTLYRVTGNEVEGSINDYVLGRVSVNDGVNVTYHHYDYDETSAQMNASLGGAIYPQVREIPSGVSSDKSTANGYIEHYYFNRYNRQGQNSSGGYPSSLDLPLDGEDSLLTYHSYYSTDNKYFENGAITPFYGREYYTATYNNFDEKVKEEVNQFGISEHDFHHFQDGNLLGETKVYAVHSIGEQVVLDGVKNKVKYVYERFPIRLRSVLKYNERIDGEEETYSHTKKYAFEVYPELKDKHRFQEVISNQDVVVSDGATQFLGATTVGYIPWEVNDELVMLPQSYYTAKLVDDLETDILSVDYTAEATQNVIAQNASIQIYETALAELALSLGLYNIAIDALRESHELAIRNYHEIQTIKFELHEQSVNLHLALTDLYNDENQVVDAKKVVVTQKQENYTRLMGVSDTKKTIAEEKWRRYHHLEDKDKTTKVVGAIFMFGYDPLRKKVRKAFKEAQEAEHASNQALSSADTAGEDLQVAKDNLRGVMDEHEHLVDQVGEVESSLVSVLAKIEEAFSQTNQALDKSSLAYYEVSLKIPDKIREKHQMAIDHIGEAQSKYSQVDYTDLLDELGNLDSPLSEYAHTNRRAYENILEKISSFRSKVRERQRNLVDYNRDHLGDLTEKHTVSRVKITDYIDEKNTFSTVDVGASDIKWVETKRVLGRDLLHGDESVWSDTKGTIHSHILRNRDKRITCAISNANLYRNLDEDLGENRAVYEDFEDDDWNSDKQLYRVGLNGRITSSEAHTGNRSYYLSRNKTESLAFSIFKSPSLAYEDQLYVLSAWVKYEGNGNVYCYTPIADNIVDSSHSHAEGSGNWEYIEFVVDGLNANNKRVSIVLEANTEGVYVDDIMLRPLKSIATITQYNEEGLVTAQITNNGLPNYFFYDSHQRQMLSIDKNGRGSNWVLHGYKRSNTSSPNSTLTVSFQDSVSYLGQLSSSRARFWNIDKNQDMAMWIELSAHDHGNTVVNWGGMELHYEKNRISFKKNRSLLRTTILTKTYQHLFLIKSGNRFFCYGDGELLLNMVGEVSANHLVVRTSIPARFFMGYEPILSQVYMDNAGRVVQHQQFNYNNLRIIDGVTVNEILYDGWGHPAVQTLTAFVVQESLNYLPDFVGSFNWSTGEMIGGIKDYLESAKARSVYQNISDLDAKYGYTQTKYENSPLNRLVDFVEVGSYFHGSNSSSKRTAYQTSEGNTLGTAIGVENTESFPSTTTTDAGEKKVSKLVDKTGRIIGEQKGSTYYSNDYDYTPYGYKVTQKLLPNHYSLVAPFGEEEDWFVNSVENKDLLGGISQVSRVDEGTREVIRNNSHEIIISETSGKGKEKVRYLKITQQKSGEDGALNLSELEIYANDYNVAQMKHVETSNPEIEEELNLTLVDGDKTNTFRVGQSEGREEECWAKVDLQQGYYVDYITIYNREDCCWDQSSNLEISLYDEGENLIKEYLVDLYQDIDAANSITITIK